MKIYIAAPWIQKDDMAKIASLVEAEGFEITHKWWEVENIAETDKTADLLRNQADADVMGVSHADLVIVLNSAKSEGKAFEQGVAIALGKPIIIVGKRGEFSKNVFHYLPSYKWVSSIEEALVDLRVIKWLTRGN